MSWEAFSFAARITLIVTLSTSAAGSGPIALIPDELGTTRPKGLKAFDSDSIRHDGPDQWRWMSLPFSRLVMNPSFISERSRPLGSDLDLNVGYYAGPRPYRMLQLATLRILDQHAAVETNAVWRSESVPGSSWQQEAAD